MDEKCGRLDAPMVNIGRGRADDASLVRIFLGRGKKKEKRERERKKYASTIIGRKLKVINKFWSPVEEKDSEKKERFGKRGHTVWLHLSKFLRVSAGTFFLLAKFRQGMQQLRLNS